MRYLLLPILLASLALAADPVPTAKLSPREALAPFGPLIGAWRGSGLPEGNTEARTKGLWTETIVASWHFGNETSIRMAIASGKYLTDGELLPGDKAGTYRLRLTGVDKKTVEYAATLKDKTLTALYEDVAAAKTRKMVVVMLHGNRFTWRFEEKPTSGTFFTRVWQVGATRQGESIADKPDPEKECIVSGGAGTIAVSHEGKTYYVCCSGCKDEFKEDPDKYIRERATRKK